MSTEEARAIVRALRAPKHRAALARLRAKAKWEQMSLTAVVAEWGDPRGWE